MKHKIEMATCFVTILVVVQFEIFQLKPIMLYVYNNR